MNNTIEIDGIKYQRIEPEKEPYVIVRCRDAGVHAGHLVSQEGRTVKLRDSRRCWRYTSGGTGSCSELSQNGLTGESRIAMLVPGVSSLLDACEVLPTSAKAMTSIREAPNG